MIKVIFTEPEAEETRKVVLIDSDMDVDEGEVMIIMIYEYC